jgi:hypothetical protein
MAGFLTILAFFFIVVAIKSTLSNKMGEDTNHEYKSELTARVRYDEAEQIMREKSQKDEPMRKNEMRKKLLSNAINTINSEFLK